MDDDSANGVKSPLSSSDFESTSTARRFKKKKKVKRAVNKRRAISSDCSSSDSDEIIRRRRRPPLTSELKNGKVGSIFDSSSESETGSNFQSGKTVPHSNPSDFIRPSSSKTPDGVSTPSCSKQAPEPSTSSSESPILVPHSKSKALVIDSDSSPDFLARPSRKISIISESPSMSSDSQNSSSIRQIQSPNPNMKDLESCQAMSTDDEGPIDYVRSTRKDNKLSSTESSGDDDDSPSCAICLSSLVNRIAAQISGCSHEFHNTCILKWSERTNTCPIDRLTFNRITVKNKQGKVVKVTEVEDKSAVAEEDAEMFLPDNCVICGNADNEDVLLLCDGCNRGFHIYCLNPPLDSVPEGNWICEHCSPVITLSDSLYLSDELDITIENFSDSNMTDPNGLESGLSDEAEQPSTSSRRTRTRNSRYRSDSTLSVSVSSRNQNISRNTRVRQTTITIKQTRKRRKRRNRRRDRTESTVRCRNRIMASLMAKRSPAVACSDGTNAEARQKMKTIKSEPGRPRLSLFSSDNFEDYYNPNSGSDAEPESSGNGPVAVTARTRYPTSRVMDRKTAVARLINTNRRPRIAPRISVPSVSSSTSSVSVLDDIMGMMDAESKKLTDKIPIKKDGTFVLPEKVDVNSEKTKTNVTETPRYPRSGGNPNRPRAQYGGPPSGGYQNSGARHQSGVFSSRGMPPQFPPRFSSFGGGRPNNENFTFFRSPQARFRPSVPRFPTRRSLPASLLIDPENEQEDPSQPDEDVDIYGDIDSTPLVPPSERTAPSTLEPPPQPPPGLFDLGPPPEPPADLLNLASPEEGPSDEDKGLIIDDNEYDPADPCDSPEPVENPPSISSDSTSDDLGAIPIPDGALPIHTCAPPPPGHVIELDSDEECPNSSLYSSTSLAFARNKAKSLTDDSNECDQNGVQNKVVTDKDDGTKKNGIAVKGAPIRFSIGTKNPVLSEPQRKIDLFNLADEEETEEEEEEEKKSEDEKEKVEDIEKIVEKEKEDKDESDKSSDEELEKTEEIAEEDKKEEGKLAVNATENDIELLNGDKHIEDLLSSPPAEDGGEEEEKEEGNSIIDLNQNSSKDDSLDVSSIISNKEKSLSLEEEIFGSDKGDENELDKDEVSTQGDILDLNTENLHGVTDVAINDGSLPETDKFDEDAKNQSGGSFNCLDGLDVDPISDSEYGSLSDNADVDEDKNKTERRKKKKRKNTDREEGEIVEPKKKDRKKSKEENNENVMGDKKSKKKKEKDLVAPLSPLQEKTLSNNKDNFRRDTAESVAWKKLSKSTKDRNYRDKDENKNKKRKEARKEIERYNVRKVVGDKAFQRKDEFGRDISLSRSHSPSVTRSPRKRSLSREKSRSPGRKNKKRRSRSRSLERFANMKRSFSRSPVRTRKRSVSPSFSKLKDRKLQKSRGRSRSRSRRRSRTPKKVRSLSRSKQKRRSRSREKIRSKSKKEKQQEVVVAYKNAVKKKKKKQRSRSWSKSKRKSKSPRARSPWDFSSTSISRSLSPAPFNSRKSRSWSRDNNLTVIVPNTKKKDKKKAKENKRRKHKDDHSPTLSKEVFTSGDNILVSVNFAHADKNVNEPVALEKVKAPAKKSKKDIQAMKAAKIREMAAKAKPVAIIDLDVSPFRERTPSPKEVIVLCDSDSENEEKSAKASELKASSGPKTPPEPHIKFSISSKNQTIGAIANPLLDIDDNKGPNTPPDPPSPLPTSPYDPFDPTKSRSPSPVSQSATNEGDLKIVSDSHEKNQLDLLKPVTPSKESTASPSKVLSMDDNSVSNLNSISKLDDKLVTSSMSTTNPSLPIYTPAMTTNSARNAMNGESMEDILNIDSDGVYSPASSLGDDLFDPPKKSPPPANKKFDSLFVPKNAPAKSIPYEPKHTKSNSLGTAGKKNSTLKYTPTKTTKSKSTSNVSKLDEDQLKILDEVPSSAVEMQVKYKYLKKLNRQERVVEEVKIVLKPHYNKKHVTKEQYKDILRKAVPKICHNKSGEINPNKIHQLIEAYVKKYRVHNKRSKNPTSSNTATNNGNAVAHSNANNMSTAKKGKSMWT